VGAGTPSPAGPAGAWPGDGERGAGAVGDEGDGEVGDEGDGEVGAEGGDDAGCGAVTSGSEPAAGGPAVGPAVGDDGGPAVEVPLRPSP
jgi:hypothetical protein